MEFNFAVTSGFTSYYKNTEVPKFLSSNIRENTPWEDEEIEFLNTCVGKYNLQKISSILHRTEKSICEALIESNEFIKDLNTKNISVISSVVDELFYQLKDSNPKNLRSFVLGLLEKGKSVYYVMSVFKHYISTDIIFTILYDSVPYSRFLVAYYGEDHSYILNRAKWFKHKLSDEDLQAIKYKGDKDKMQKEIKDTRNKNIAVLASFMVLTAGLTYLVTTLL